MNITKRANNIDEFRNACTEQTSKNKIISTYLLLHFMRCEIIKNLELSYLAILLDHVKTWSFIHP